MSATAGVPTQAKGKVDADCSREVSPVHVSWQQDLKQSVHQKKPLGCAEVYPLECKRVLSAA